MNIDRRCFMRSVGLAAAAGFAPRLGAAKSKPNIILIMADDLGYETLGCYGGESFKTPVLDQLAKSGMRFDYCYSQPLCTPTRVQLMTGRYNFRNYYMFGYLELGEVTFGHVLKKAGYKTCIAGKWQLGNGIEGPNYAGFDEYCLWQIYNSVAGKVVKGSRYADPLIYENGKPLQNTKGKYGPDIVCDYIVDFIERKKEQPFFVYYPMILTHAPYQPTPDSPEWSTDRKAKDVSFFGDMVTYMDKMVGKIVTKLDELGLRENTLVMFLGDNGTGKSVTSRFRGKRYEGGKGTMTEAGMHVPFIASWPGVVPAGQVNKDLIDFSDFFPTLVDLAGATLPAKREIDGRSFLPQLKGEKGRPRKWIYSYYWGRNPLKARRMVQGRRYKLFDDGTFYDIQSDPLQQNPLAEDQMSGKVREIKARYGDVLHEMMSKERW